MTGLPLLVCCGVLRREVESLLAQGQLTGLPRFLDSSLCCNYPALGKALNRALAGPSSSGSILVFGLCHPAIDTIAAQHGARRVRATNCIAMLIGEDDYGHALAHGEYFVLPGWASRWRQVLVEDLGLDQETAPQLLAGELTTAVYLDTGAGERSYDPLAGFTAFTGLPVERRTTRLDRLASIISEAISAGTAT